MSTEVRRFHLEIAELRERIDWNYFFWAWGLGSQDATSEACQSLKAEAEAMLKEWEGSCSCKALLMRTPANSDGDDILIGDNLELRLPMLRQQKVQEAGKPLLSMADFVRPLAQGVRDEIGLFCTTVDAAIEYYEDDPYLRMMAQTLADRLAEATAERINDEMPGIRPAVGYPMMPDMSMNFVIDSILDMKQIGITLTTSGMMQPHASVSGMILPNPGAVYFNIGAIGDDQLEDYAQRRGMSREEIRRFVRK